jgi:hypothetical protein
MNSVSGTSLAIVMCSLFRYYILVGSDRACAPVRCAHPFFWAKPNGALRVPPRPPPIPASLLLIRPQKINEKYRKLCAGATICRNFFRFILFLYSFLIFSFCYLFLLFSPF